MGDRIDHGNRLPGKLLRGVKTLMTGHRPSPQDWQARYRAAVAARPVAEVLARHRNAAALADGFCIGSYLERNADVADAVDSPGEAAFHYLEFGQAEGRAARADTWDAGFVRQFHGIDLAQDLSPDQVRARLSRAGVAVDAMLLSESQFWLSLGVHGPVMAQVFDHEIYYALADAGGMTPPATERLTCIRHFRDTGLDAGVPPHPLHRFDEDFYRAAVDWRGLEPPMGDPRPHWVRVGMRGGCHANPAAQLSVEAGVELPDAVRDRLADFAAASPDLADGASLPAIVHHLAHFPMPGIAAFDMNRPDVAGFCRDLARSLRARGHADAAEKVLWHILATHPTDPGTSLDLADLIHVQHRVATEIDLRENVPPGFDTGANQITLAERLAGEGRFADALGVADMLPDTLFGFVDLTRRRLDLGRGIFGRVWSDLSAQIAQVGVAGVQDILARALVLATPPGDAPPRATPIRRVAILANDDLYQCKLYRADQKLDQLRAMGLEAQVFGQSGDVAALQARLDRFDAVIFMRVAAFPPIIDLIAAANAQGLATFYDCDDLIFDAAHFPPPLDTYSGQIGAEDHAAMACGVPLFAHAMRMCSYGIASTPSLQAAMAPRVRTGQVFLHRNALGAAHLRAMSDAPARAPGKVVLFYGSGTKAHKAEFHDQLEPALAHVLKARRGKVELRIVGMFGGFRHLDPRHPDLHLLDPIWDFEAYVAELARADINLSVLAPSPLTDAKSEIKWMEAAMFGIPSIVSPTATHRGVIEDGVTGILAGGKSAFRKALLRLIDDAAARDRIGQAARDRVLRDYGLPAMADTLGSMFDAVRPVPTTAAPKPRLLFVNVFYPPQDIGGATRVMRDTVADLLDRYGDRFEIDVITTLEGGTVPYDVTSYGRDGVRVWAITAGPMMPDMTVQDRRMGDVFDRLLDRIRPDLVHFHCIQRLTTSVVDVVRRRAVPYVITLHDGWWVSPNQFVNSPSGRPETYDFTDTAALPDRARITYRGLRDAAAVVAVSEDFAKLHRAARLPFVTSVENGLLRPLVLDRMPGTPGRVRLGHVGGAARHKGASLLRAAVESVRLVNTDLMVVDHGLPMGQSRRENWNGTPVTMLPRVPLDRVAEIYGQLDVLLAPSTWPESYGLVTREALSAGLWVVASDRGAIGRDIDEGRTGHVVPVDDHRALAACLQRIDAAPELYGKPPAATPDLRRSTAQTDDLVALYAAILARPPGSEHEV